MVSVTSRVRKRIGRLIGNRLGLRGFGGRVAERMMPSNTQNPKPAVKPYPEVFIVSHPKCGRTWLAVMLSKVLNDIYNLNTESEFSLASLTSNILENTDKSIRVAGFHHDTSCFRLAHRFSYLKHDKKKDFSKKHVILLVRDPRDVLVSSYHQIVGRDKNAHEIEPNLSKFIRDDVYGIRKLLAFYESWDRNREVPLSFKVIRYEDMHRDPGEALRKVLETMNVRNADANAIRRAVEGATFDKMQKMEREGAYNAGALANVADGNINSMKARKGKIGGYVDELSNQDIEYLNSMIKTYGCSFYRHDELFIEEAC